jgi:AcrR family transcriptional regulator
MPHEPTTAPAETQDHRLTLEDLGITTDDIARAMGYAGGADQTHFGSDLEALLVEAPQHASIRAGFRVLPAGSFRIEREYFWVDDRRFDAGRIIAAPLKGAETLALFVTTAGPGMTAWTQALMAEPDMLRAYFVDAIGSEIADRAADWIEARVAEWASEHGQRTSNRYSPGYCDWNVYEQHKLFSFLPDGFCDIHLTESALMQPEKSVSGIIGIGGRVKRVDYACNICEMEHCFRRRLRPDPVQ